MFSEGSVIPVEKFSEKSRQTACIEARPTQVLVRQTGINRQDMTVVIIIQEKMRPMSLIIIIF